MKPKYILDELIKLDINNCFNPYTSNCVIHDHKNSYKIRRTNLLNYLKFIKSYNSQIIWVGEVLGYRGGRRTGIPFVDDYHLDYIRNNLQIDVNKATTSNLKEMSAGIIWSEIEKLDNVPFLWNIFALHPHLPSKPLSNRSIKSSEVGINIHILQYILNNYPCDKIVAIGKSSFNTLQKLNYDCIYGRHPAHGGAIKFRDQIARLY